MSNVTKLNPPCEHCGARWYPLSDSPRAPWVRNHALDCPTVTKSTTEHTNEGDDNVD